MNAELFPWLMQLNDLPYHSLFFPFLAGILVLLTFSLLWISLLSVDDEVSVSAPQVESWVKRLHQGLTKSRQALQGQLQALFSEQRGLDAATLTQLRELLLRADVGVAGTEQLLEAVKSRFEGKDAVEWAAVEQALYDKSYEIMLAAQNQNVAGSKPPQVVLIIGVNGVGKTTSLAKIAARYQAEGKNVMLCAADTYRAAAIEQLQTWGERLGVKVIAQQQGSDPAAVAYDGMQAALARGADVLLIDTAGRLHNQENLMQELGKIHKSLGKLHPEAPHETLLVIDATTGQNAKQQVKVFNEIAKITGLVATKLDGTAKGGILISLAKEFQIPIRYIGVGEQASDLQAFKPEDFLASLFSGARV